MHSISEFASSADSRLSIVYDRQFDATPTRKKPVKRRKSRPYQHTYQYNQPLQRSS